MPTAPGRNCGYSVSGVASLTGLAVLALVVGTASTTFVRANEGARDVVSLAVPARSAEPVWDDERRAFAARLQRGYGIDHDDAVEFAGWILEASVRQDLEPELLASVVMVESSFRKDVRSITGAVGPAQVRPDLWWQFCGGDLYDPEQNLYCGAHILGYYRDVCALTNAESLTLAEECALRAYNVGFGNRNNVYFLAAATRYLDKIDRYREPLNG
ncbi:MAG: transglycosylase SLT domain-containing protein [Gammaproteobacteria bacterium]|nr:transglycosylase SLT domain-containing protein [Gammaproteobacteria bacterium]